MVLLMHLWVREVARKTGEANLHTELSRRTQNFLETYALIGCLDLLPRKIL